MELLETVTRFKSDEDEVAIHLITARDDYDPGQQEEYLRQIQASAPAAGIRFTWEVDESNSIHARHITTDNGWKITLDRGLDIFQRYDMRDASDFSNKLQEYRPVKPFEVTYIRVGELEE